MIVRGLLLLLVVAGCRPGPSPAEVRSRWQRAYADQAHDSYGDALDDARALEEAVTELIEHPRRESLEEARAAWVEARASYARTEVFRFSGGPIDAVERLVDAWPIDESGIDYVREAPFAGLVNDPALHPRLSAEHLAGMNEREGEASVTTGYHAIEFLLWGQDLNPTGPGQRPASDYLPTILNGRRRGQYLMVVTHLLVRHLEGVVAAWSPTVSASYRSRFLALELERALEVALTGAHRFLSGELGGERLTVPYETRDQEDEESCFSDNTHNDIVSDLLGFDRLLGSSDGGGPGEGPGLQQVVALVDEGLAARMVADLRASLAAARSIPPPFDRAIQGDDAGFPRQSVLRTIEAVRALADTVARARPTLVSTRE